MVICSFFLRSVGGVNELCKFFLERYEKHWIDFGMIGNPLWGKLQLAFVVAPIFLTSGDATFYLFRTGLD